MSDHGLLLVAAAALATIVGVAAPVPELGFMLQCSGLGALIGTAVAHRAQTRRRGPSRAEIIARYTLVGGAIGCAFAAFLRLRLPLVIRVVLFVGYALVGCLALALLGAGDWDPWAQLGGWAVVFISSTWILPGYFYRGEPWPTKRNRQRR